MRSTAERHRLVAVLGPTNTGKTHLAIDRMLGHATGMIGFPLRLLARENYDRAAGLRGRFRVEGPGGFSDQDMGFTPAVDVLHQLSVRQHPGGLFEISVTDGNDPARTYHASFTNLASVGGQIGFHRADLAAEPGGLGLFDNLTVRRIPEPGAVVQLAVFAFFCVGWRRRLRGAPR